MPSIPKTKMNSHLIRSVFILANIISYWGLLPWLFLLAAKHIDQLLKLPVLPTKAGIGIGAVSLFLGIVISLWATVTLYLRGNGFPIALLPPFRLVGEGPYSLSRHPLYLAFTIYLLGWGALAQSIGLILVVLPGFVIIWGGYTLLHEERVLLRRFQGQYRVYRQETPFLLRFRHAYPGPGIVFALLYVVGKLLVRLLFPITVVGREFLPQSGPAIIVANHACYLDPIFITAATNRYIRFLTTAEMMRTSVGRHLFTRLGSISIRRYTSDLQAVRALLFALKEGETVGIFAEGERTWDGNPLPITAKVTKLLSRANVPIVPIRIEGSYAIFPRWARFPLPGRIRVRIFPPFLPPLLNKNISSILAMIAAQSDGQTWFRRSASGISQLLWACPICHEVGTIYTHGPVVHCQHCNNSWRIDRRLILHSSNGKTDSLASLAASLKAEEIFKGQKTLSSDGKVNLLEGEQDLQLIASGKLQYQAGVLHVGSVSFPVGDARSLTIEGRNRLDIGLGQGRRVRLRFRSDSSLKWQQFLQLELRRDP